jgi:hypothetical protein
MDTIALATDREMVSERLDTTKIVSAKVFNIKRLTFASVSASWA